MRCTLALLVAAVAAAAPAQQEAVLPPGVVVPPPAVIVQAIAERNRLEGHERFFGPGSIDALPVSVVVLNNSERELRGLELLAASQDFERAGAVALPATIPPYGSFHGRMVLQPRADAGYGHRDVLLLLRYRWTTGRQEVTSMQTATIGVEIQRPFEDEAAGLPGGTAALFSLLLPVLFAFFTYEIVDRLRKGEGIQLPSFGSEYVFPSFFIGVLANTIGLRWSRGVVLAGAAILGALWPLARWGWELIQRYRWAFSEKDGDAEYLRKALLGPRAPRRFVRVTGTLRGETWSGIRLLQPDGELVLGAALQAIPAAAAHQNETRVLVDAINSGAGKRERKRLLGLVKAGACTLTHLQKVQHGGNNWSAVVAVEEVAGLGEMTTDEGAALLKATT